MTPRARARSSTALLPRWTFLPPPPPLLIRCVTKSVKKKEGCKVDRKVGKERPSEQNSLFLFLSSSSSIYSRVGSAVKNGGRFFEAPTRGNRSARSALPLLMDFSLSFFPSPSPLIFAAAFFASGLFWLRIGAGCSKWSRWRTGQLQSWENSATVERSTVRKRGVDGSRNRRERYKGGGKKEKVREIFYGDKRSWDPKTRVDRTKESWEVRFWKKSLDSFLFSFYFKRILN